MNRFEAKRNAMSALKRFPLRQPVEGHLAEIGGTRRLFRTHQEALNFILSQPEWLREDANEMPTIAHGYYRTVLIH